MNTPLYSTLLSIRDKLRHTRQKLVLAESCTAGLAAAKLGAVPGISEHFCGSMVVYQTQSKMDWLAVDETGLLDPGRGPVSSWASNALALAVLRHTNAASVSAAITGHLGPNAPPQLDGKVFCALRAREGSFFEASFQLNSPAPLIATDLSLRQTRQEESAERFLEWIEAMLK